MTKSQESAKGAALFLAGDHKAARNRQDRIIKTNVKHEKKKKKKKKRSTKEAPPWSVT